ncbi:hypothetical protein ACFFMR_29190 [Micromonospora andamanensis]|uniref:Uncharacterized protein n=1 Tax=Micromonospora andamanensis TaxID=1287068 RepID=A0ABQ4HSE0_9ACTN|nr:hypothetical protein [Micromonospora andamanensis]GIJ08436.1 hypothetical protein Van01_16500 [Micromonospora andamanensis]
MSTPCYIGATSPDTPHLAHARYVLFDGRPAVVLPALAAIWARHAHHDTAALIGAVLAHDWEHLDPDTTAATTSAFAGQQPVPGIGMTLASSTNGVADTPEPITVFPLCHAGHLDVEWVYLIEADTATIGVYTSDGTRTATYHLTTCLDHASSSQGSSRPCAAGVPR